ncbi:hypothetical protein B5V88_00115 [Heyndrickxia sporothermodurans]|uniref:DUF2326 domain-containing protein n=6 Tax=Heyndrickxia sporothermodurans TaxID=46224 RepID=A0AB37HFJ5_9BACI|nr:DUF2326 domain-containing protein [Heyndrickxia sporothermodurans]MBL5769294.1 DUF2326 domain-containing protein [Heyndrickxia sporothermodurans]MBL5773069.1 DUF2326 domain-containing protein [Heyndrickxia sporothermodurans]MBL5776562.1 DUF2326 domain-containing protein [Heyndrickxia sporothermodurans]MBL5783670.1 DUF2326 domain-containing protein [Heyndrickxia sporothermodurans]MBL5787168.1 DUF2326 domain-containing protein [Heyndrickxia sporothermodurans]
MKILEYSSELLECDEWDYTNLVLNTTSENVTPATAILNEKLNFDILRNYDYRKLVGYFIRTQNDYSDVFQLKKFSSSTDQVWKPFVYELLGFESDVLLKRYELNNEIENLKTKIKNMEDYYSASDIDRINGQIDILTREKDMLEQDLDSFNFYLNEKQISKELIKEIENKSISLQNKAYNLRSDIELIENSLATKEFLDFDYIKELFTEVEIYFSDQLEKSYEELINFNKSLLEDRRVHLSKLLSEKKIELKIVDDKLKEVGKQRSNILNVLQDNDVINKYKHLRSNLIEKEKSIQSLETQKEIILQTRTDIKELNEKKKELEIINETIDNKIESGNKVLNDIRYLFKTYFEKITSKNGIIDISTNTTSNVEFNAGIITDNGTLTHEDEGFSYRKMLCMCFDLAILSYYSNKSFFKFLYHDGPFEALHENRKESYLEFIEDYCADNDVQYIISLIDSDVSSDKLNKEDIVCKLEQNEDGSGALFGFKY